MFNLNYGIWPAVFFVNSFIIRLCFSNSNKKNIFISSLKAHTDSDICKDFNQVNTLQGVHDVSINP